MISLPNITLITMTSLNVKAHEEALKKSSEGIKFGDTKLIYEPKLKSIDDWNHAIIYDLPKYVATEFCILIHADGHIIHPELWQDRWLRFDYAGSPWPLPQDDFSYRDEEGNIVRVGNSVSLRSKKLMDLAATRPWKSYYGNTNEDGFICCHNRKWLESQGCRFMGLDEAIYFGKEHTIPENKDIKETFLFHHVDR